MTREDQELLRKKRHRAEMRRRRLKRQKQKFAGLLVLCFFVVLFCSHAAIAAGNVPRIIIKAKSMEMMQDEALPDFKAEVKLNNEKYENMVLDPESDYTVKDLLQELNSGEYYEISCEADGKMDGVYPIVLELDAKLDNKVIKDWFGKITIVGEDADLTVKNKTGVWKGDQFERYDGTLVTNDFVKSGKNTYYFDENGNKVTGLQEINGAGYWFDKKGAMKSGWRKTEEGNYYYGDDGRMLTSWLELDGEKYCFGADGKMLTGEQQVGSKKCVFSEDGKLVSEESHIDSTKPMVALTFDDGPGDRTMELLETLEKYDAHATFFMVGQNAAKYPDEIRKMSEIGCELGNHSFDHTSLATLDVQGIASQMNRTNDLIKEADGQHTATVMRPPFGATNDTVKANVGLPIILWSIDTLDWKTLNTESTVNSIMTLAEDGDIILMHDIHSASIDAAIQVIPQLINQGYQLVTVSEMADAKGIVMKNGTIYTDFCPEDDSTD